MVEIEYFDDGIRIENDHYYLFLDGTRGGTITKYGVNGEDSIVKREGVQVHLGDNNGTHYEQEYSEYCEIKVIDVSNNNIIVNVKSYLVNPNNKSDIGAECFVLWFFNDSEIIVSTFIVKYISDLDYNSFSRYIIADANTFNSFRCTSNYGFKTGNIPIINKGSDSDRVYGSPAYNEIFYLNNEFVLKSKIIPSCWLGNKEPYSESTLYYSWSMQELIHYSIINRNNGDSDVATIEYCLVRRKY